MRNTDSKSPPSSGTCGRITWKRVYTGREHMAIAGRKSMIAFELASVRKATVDAHRQEGRHVGSPGNLTKPRGLCVREPDAFPPCWGLSSRRTNFSIEPRRGAVTPARRHGGSS